MSKIFSLKTNHAFYQTVFAVGVVISALFFATLEVYHISRLYLEILMHKIKDACGCESMAQFFSMHPDIFRAVMLFGIGIGIFIFYSLYKLIKLNLQTKKYIDHYLSFKKSKQSSKLKSAIKMLELAESRIVEIDGSNLAVFCFGYLKPKICISHSLVEMLSRRELIAVLSHEAQHMENYEPLKLFFVKYFRSIFFFLPSFSKSVKKYITFSELAADERASDNLEARSNLASAILKISDKEERLQMENGSSLSFFSSALEDRVSRLSDETYIPKFRFLDKSLIIGSLGLVIVSLFTIFIFSDSTKAFEMHSNSACILQENSKNDSFCDLVDRKKNNNIGKMIVHNADSINFQQNPICNLK